MRRLLPSNFLVAMSVVSIIGFLSIISDSLFFIDISKFMETLWLITLGIGLISETSMKELKKIKKKGLDSPMLGKITMVVLGSLAIVSGLLSFPGLNITHSAFLAIKGITAILAVIFIIIETWVKPK